MSAPLSKRRKPIRRNLTLFLKDDVVIHEGRRGTVMFRKDNGTYAVNFADGVANYKGIHHKELEHYRPPAPKVGFGSMTIVTPIK